jgi:hypothetical protein
MSDYTVIPANPDPPGWFTLLCDYPTIFARMAVLQTIHRHEVFNPDRKDPY